MSNRGELSYPLSRQNVKDLNDMLSELYRQRRTGAGIQAPSPLPGSNDGVLDLAHGGTGADLSTTGTGSLVLESGSAIALNTPLPVQYGGNGAGTFTAYSVLCGGTTATGAFQPIPSVGTSGQVLTSNGAGALPTMQTISAGNSDLVTDAVSFTAADLNGGSTTPIPLIAAQGSGTIVVPVHLFIHFRVTSVFSASPAFNFRYIGGSTSELFTDWAPSLGANGYKNLWRTADLGSTSGTEDFSNLPFGILLAADTTGGAISGVTGFITYLVATIP